MRIKPFLLSLLVFADLAVLSPSGRSQSGSDSTEIPPDSLQIQSQGGARFRSQNATPLVVNFENGRGSLSLQTPNIPVEPDTEYKATLEFRVTKWNYGSFFFLQSREYGESGGPPLPNRIARSLPDFDIVLPSVGDELTPRYLSFKTGPDTHSVRLTAALRGNPVQIAIHRVKLEKAVNEKRPRAVRPVDQLRPLEEVNTYLAEQPGKDAILKQRGGRTVIAVNGEPTAPVLYQRTYWEPKDSLHQYFAKAGVKFQVVQVPVGPYRVDSGKVVPGIWRDHGDYDFSVVDEVLERALRADPDILLVPGLTLTPFPSWGDKYPDDIIQNEKGEKGVGSMVHNIAYRNTRDDSANEFWCPSLSSARYLADTTEVVQRLIAHMRTKPYFKSVVGFMLYGGDDGQWGSWARSGPLNHGDFSPAGLAAFRAWLSRKYLTVSELQAAWRSSSVTFEDAEVPAIAARRPAKRVFLDPQTEQNVIDYITFDSQVKGRTIDHFAEAIKKACEKPVLVGTYFQDPLYGRENNCYQEHLRLRSKWVDFFVSPLDYGPWRRPGWAGGAFSACADSLRLHEKLYLCELDLRTSVSSYLSDAYDYYTIGRLTDRKAFDAVNLRETGLLMSYGMGQWYYAMAGGSFYADYAIEGVQQSASLYRQMLAEDVASFAPEVAVFADGESNSYISRVYQNTLLYPSLNVTRSSLFLSGIPIAIYQMEDLLNPDLPDYKMYVFLNAWRLSQEQRNAINSTLKKNGKTLVWIHAAGYLDETGASAENIAQTTGMTVTIGNAVENLAVRPADSPPPAFAKLLPRQGTAFDPIRAQRITIADEAAIPIGVYSDSKQTANAIREFPEYRSVLIASPGGLGPDLLNAIARHSGIEPLSDYGNLAQLRNGLLVLHGVAGGPSQLKLPTEASLSDLVNGDTLESVSRSVSVPLEVGQTRLFRVIPRGANPESSSSQ